MDAAACSRGEARKSDRAVCRPDVAPLSRRALLAGLVAANAAHPAEPTVGLSFGSYALWMLTWEDSLELIARTGYDGVELALMPDWPTEPKLLSARDRLRIRSRLLDLGLALPALLENLRALDPIQTPAENLERLRRAIDLGAELAPGKPPLFETVLGRNPGKWDEIKHELADAVGEWARVAADADTVICFKPHANHAVNNVDRSLWLVSQVGSPHFRCTYDYSHLWLAGHDLVESLDALLPVSPYVHLKDARGTSEDYRFLLPGDGETDYVTMFRRMRQAGYRGYANVEISAQIHKLPEFEPIAAARICYDRMASAFEEAQLLRP